MTRFAAILAASFTLLVSGRGAAQEPPAPAAPGGPVTAPVVSKAASPPATDALKVEWVTVSAPDVGIMLAAVARPPGAGPFPAVVLLHGSHGFAREYVQLAEALARGGVLAVAPCWFTGGEGPGTKFVSPIPCPDAPPISEPGGRLAVRTVSALVQAVRTLPDVQADSIGLFGHSRGSGATLAYIMGESDPAVRAAVLENGGYPPDWTARAAQVKAPVLILHGGVFKASDGGSPLTKAEMARAFEAALKRAGKPVEATYYEYGGHNSFFADAKQRDDEIRRMVAFYARHLRRTP